MTPVVRANNMKYRSFQRSLGIHCFIILQVIIYCIYFEKCFSFTTTKIEFSLLHSLDSIKVNPPQQQQQQELKKFKKLRTSFIEYIDDDDDGEYDIQPVATEQKDIPFDMKYTPINVKRQNANYKQIRDAGGKETVNDIYVRDPETQTFWFVGKVSRCTGTVSVEEAIRKQWNLIEQHAARLRPFELAKQFGNLEIWAAPPDSEMEVAYNKPSITFQKITPNPPVKVNTVEVGFQTEVYLNGDEEGFRTLRTDEGLPVKTEINGDVTANPQQQQHNRRASDNEMDELMKILNQGLEKQNKIDEL